MKNGVLMIIHIYAKVSCSNSRANLVLNIPRQLLLDYANSPSAEVYFVRFSVQFNGVWNKKVQIVVWNCWGFMLYYLDNSEIEKLFAELKPYEDAYYCALICLTCGVK